MRIERLHVENFRSIRSLDLTDIPDIAVFYGPNGSGKSNVLAAIDAFWRLLESGAHTQFHEQISLVTEGFTAEDLHRGGPGGSIVFEGTVAFGERADGPISQKAERVSVRFGVTVTPRGVQGRVLRLETSQARTPNLSPDIEETEQKDWYRALLRALSAGWMLVPELRGVPVKDSAETDAIAVALTGNFEKAAFLAHTSPDVRQSVQLEKLQAVLARPPLNRPPFRTVRYPDGRYAIQEIHQDGTASYGVSLDRAGLGIRQIYTILGSIVLSGAPIVGIEEPEAHLHALTSGKDLRDILRGLVPDTVNQLFVATHSELFDLDPTGYYDVRLDPERGTVVERRTDLADIDRRHTYMPGAARHALIDALNRGEPDRFVFERPDGTGIRASEMRDMLVRDDRDALAFLETVTDAAVRLVTLKTDAKLTR
jgi:hypothetical protein